MACDLAQLFLLFFYVMMMIVLACKLVFVQIPYFQHIGSLWKDADDATDELSTDQNYPGVFIGVLSRIVCVPLRTIVILGVRIKYGKQITKSKDKESNGEMDTNDVSDNKRRKNFPETTDEVAVSDQSDDEAADSNEECTTPSPLSPPSPCDDCCSNHPEDDSSKTTESQLLENPEDAEMGEEVNRHSCVLRTIAKEDCFLHARCRPILGDRQLRQKYGVLEEDGRYKMLLLCAKKARQQGNRRYGMELKGALEEFLHKKIKIGRMSYKDFCREVVRLVPEDKWMRFVRLHLNLEEEEIQAFKRKYCTFNDEQKRQIQQEMLHVK